MQSLSATDRKGEITRRFNQIAATYDGNRAIRAAAERLLQLAHLQPGQEVLDVSCGTGLLALPAARAVGPGGRVVGVDLTEGMVVQARRKAQEAGLSNLELRVGDAEHLEVEDTSCDVVICGLAVMFYPDPTGAAREWFRVLRPGGRVAFSVWRQQFGSTQRALLDARFKALGVVGLQLADADTREPDFCQKLLEQAGFVDVAVQTEQHGFFFASAEQYWQQDVASSISGSSLARLTPDQRAQLKEEHLAEVAALASAEGIWRDAAVNFALGRKP